MATGRRRPTPSSTSPDRCSFTHARASALLLLDLAVPLLWLAGCPSPHSTILCSSPRARSPATVTPPAAPPHCCYWPASARATPTCRSLPELTVSRREMGMRDARERGSSHQSEISISTTNKAANVNLSKATQRNLHRITSIVRSNQVTHIVHLRLFQWSALKMNGLSSICMMW